MWPFSPLVVRGLITSSYFAVINSFTPGLIFGLGYCISYTCARTLQERYGYNALKTGLVLLAYGIGKLPPLACYA